MRRPSEPPYVHARGRPVTETARAAPATGRAVGASPRLAAEAQPWHSGKEVPHDAHDVGTVVGVPFRWMGPPCVYAHPRPAARAVPAAARLDVAVAGGEFAVGEANWASPPRPQAVAGSAACRRGRAVAAERLRYVPATLSPPPFRPVSSRRRQALAREGTSVRGLGEGDGDHELVVENLLWGRGGRVHVRDTISVL